ncbi:MAG: hypothetical protein COA45_07095 [Zetaproteobacteria bacterium]|nr:MAG: hypothetical protein COA45_07095 [Zetaproteobacteria bacterium]
MKKKNLAISTILSTAVLGLSATGALAHLEPKTGEAQEKCYGVVKAGDNDCASKIGDHSCAGLSDIDGSSGEWIKLPKGLCDKLVGSALTEGEIVDPEAVHIDDGHAHTENDAH